MKANELRIGNYARQSMSSLAVVATQIIQRSSDNGYNIIDDRGYTRTVEEIKPIPLTEEWLLKFGFEDMGKSYMGWYVYKKGNFTIIDEQCIFSFCYENMSGDDIDLEIKYVHQLQNLYFALTGKELKTLKL